MGEKCTKNSPNESSKKSLKNFTGLGDLYLKELREP